MEIIDGKLYAWICNRCGLEESGCDCLSIYRCTSGRRVLVDENPDTLLTDGIFE